MSLSLYNIDPNYLKVSVGGSYANWILLYKRTEIDVAFHRESSRYRIFYKELSNMLEIN
jgi:hypothetical protein